MSIAGPLGPLDGVRHIVESAQRFQAEADSILGTQRATPAPEDEKPSVSYSGPTPLLIALGGHMEAGKDALADHLVAHHGFEKVGMSEPLATALYTQNPWIRMTAGWSAEEFARWATDNDWDISQGPQNGEFARWRDLIDIAGYVAAKRIPEVRRALQVLGTEVVRDQLGEDIWAEACARRVMDIRATGVPVVISRVQYANEADMVRRLGGHLVWVERPGAANIGIQVIEAIDGALSAERAQVHSSEVSLTQEDFSITIQNHGSLADLKAAGDRLVAALGAVGAVMYPIRGYEAPTRRR